MARRKKGEKIDGWVNLDKPEGLTSTQAMAKVRRIFGAQKAGHAGTLDPLATGILPIALGEATKTIPFAQDRFKTYEFTITWGEQRDTDDREGQVIATSAHRPTMEDITAALPEFTGHIQQMPPQYSALKINGERAYDIARSGEHVDLKPRPVFIESLELLKAETNHAAFTMTCGKGTYVRSLARDLARILGTCGYISVLRRTQVGPFTTESAISLDKLQEIADSPALGEALLPLATVLDDIPALAIRADEQAKLRNGQFLSFVSRPDFERLKNAGLGKKGTALALFQNSPVALVETEGPKIKPVRVFNF